MPNDQKLAEDVIHANGKLLNEILERLVVSDVPVSIRKSGLNAIAALALAEQSLHKYLVEVGVEFPSGAWETQSLVEPSLIAKARKLFAAPLLTGHSSVDDAAVVPTSGPSYASGVNVKVVYCCADNSYAGLAPSINGWACPDNIPCQGCQPYT